MVIPIGCGSCDRGLRLSSSLLTSYLQESFVSPAVHIIGNARDLVRGIPE